MEVNLSTWIFEIQLTFFAINPASSKTPLQKYFRIGRYNAIPLKKIAGCIIIHSEITLRKEWEKKGLLFMDYPFDISVFYALHESGKSVSDFPEQSLASKRIQVIPVIESDDCNPLAQSLSLLGEAKGSYTIFLDAGDCFPETFLEQMLALAKQNAGSFVMPYSRRNFADVSYSIPPLKDTCNIDTSSNPIEFPVRLHGLLIPTSSLQEAVRSIQEPVEREKHILLYLLSKNPVFSYLGGVVLSYVQPKESDVQYSVLPHRREWYFDSFERFLLPVLSEAKKRCKKVPLLLQHLAKYMINIRFNANRDNRNKFVLDFDDVTRFTELMSSVLDYVSAEVLLDTTIRLSHSDRADNLIKFRMKKRDWNWYPECVCTDTSLSLQCDGITYADLESLSVSVNLIDYQDGCLEIDGSYPDYFPEDIRVSARLGSDTYELKYNQRYSLKKYFGITFLRSKTFHVSVPVPTPDVIKKNPSGELMLNFYLQTSSDLEYRMNYNFPSHTSRFANCFTAGYWKFGSYLSFNDEKGIHILVSNPWRVLKMETKLWIQMAKNPQLRKYLLLKIPNFVLRPWFNRQHIWLFMDKIYKGGDSSEYIYKYTAAQKDGIRKYYLLDASSADYARMKKEGYHPLKRGSMKHRLIFLNASMVIASNSTVFAFNSYSTTTSQAIRGDVHFDVACVQHGMSIQKIAKAQQRLRDNTKLYFCASKYEIENLSKPIYDYAGYDILKLTGVPRHDGLKSRAEKIILLSPTWRMNSVLPATRGESVERAYNPHFKETDYYRIYNGLINDPRLLASAEKYGYRIQYVLHPLISPQEKDFTKNEYVEIIPSIGDTSYEKLFCEAALMVTDYSGVQFDFAYMRKPVVYLHHQDIPQHYEEGTFFYETMGFGEICRTNEELIGVLCQYMENDCRMPDLYRKRADDFFAFSDNNNCARIYPVMLEHEKNRSWPGYRPVKH